MVTTIDNRPPVVQPIPNQTMPEDGLRQLVLGVSDDRTPNSRLTYAVQSSNPALLPASAITVTVTGEVPRMTIPPLPDQFGVARIDLRVGDEQGLVTTVSFAVTEVPVNAMPTLDAIGDLTLEQDSGEVRVALTGQGTLRLRPVPGRNGRAVITVTVKDDGGAEFGVVDTISRQFSVTVNPVVLPNLPPAVNLTRPTKMAGPTGGVLRGRGFPRCGALTGEALTNPWQHAENLHLMEFSPGGAFLATVAGLGKASPGWEVRVWRVADGAPVSPPLPHPAGL